MKKRIVLCTLIISLAWAPLVFADGPILTSAKRAVQELATVEATRAPATAATAAVVQQDPSGGSNARTKLWIALGLAVVLVFSMKVLDRRVEDATPSSRRTRRDIGGCTPLCQ